MTKFVLGKVVMVVFILVSCEPAAVFDKPQPDNTNPLHKFPEILHGKYLDQDQASILTITENLILREYDFDFIEHKENFGPSYKFIGDSILHLSDGTKEQIIIKGDSVIQHANWTDTVFKFSANNVLKKFKGYYFLNHRFSDQAWEVSKLSLHKGTLSVGNISGKDDIQKLREITETTSDTSSTHFSLSRRQFRKFIKQGGFGEKETFTRIKENNP